MQSSSNFNGAYFEEAIDLRDASVERSLGIHWSRIGSAVKMSRFKTSKGLFLENSKFENELEMVSGRIEGDLLAQESEFGDVDLNGIKVEGVLSLYGTSVNGRLTMDSGEIGGDLFMRGADFEGPINFIFLNVGSNLDVRRSKLWQLDLTGASIKGELRLGSSSMKDIEWKDSPRLTLRNTSVGTLQETVATWPARLDRELEGLKYERFGGFGKGEKEGPSERGSKWYIEWLEKDKSYSPGPYRHLAGVLRVAGYGDIANDILYANRERERNLAWGARNCATVRSKAATDDCRQNRVQDFAAGKSEYQMEKCWRLSLLMVVIGYGYGQGYFRALLWVAGLVALGTVFLCISGERKKHKVLYGLPSTAFYSLDMLLPIVRLREKHYTDVDLTTFAKYYFAVHIVAEYVLVSFVVAGLSGLTE